MLKGQNHMYKSCLVLQHGDLAVVVACKTLLLKSHWISCNSTLKFTQNPMLTKPITQNLTTPHSEQSAGRGIRLQTVEVDASRNVYTPELNKTQVPRCLKAHEHISCTLLCSLTGFMWFGIEYLQKPVQKKPVQMSNMEYLPRVTGIKSCRRTALSRELRTVRHSVTTSIPH